MGAHLEQNGKGFILRPVIDVDSTTIEGCGPKRIVDSGCVGPWNISLDATSVYWHCYQAFSGIYAADLDGTNQRTIIQQNGYIMSDWLVDGSNMYADGIEAYPNTVGNNVFITPLDASASPSLFLSNLYSPQLAVDATYAYWGDAGTIWKAPKTTTPAKPTAVTDASSTYNGAVVAVDANNVYWWGGYYHQPSQLFWAPKSGGTSTQILGGSPFYSPFLELQPRDSINASLYASFEGTIYAVTGASGGAQATPIVARPAAANVGWQIVGSKLLWLVLDASNNLTLWEQCLPSGTATGLAVIAADASDGFMGFRANATDAYVEANWGIYRVHTQPCP